MGTPGFPRIAVALQKVGLGDSNPLSRNRVPPEDIGYGGVVTVTDPVSIQLKDIYRGEYLILKQVVELQVGAEVSPL